MSSPLGLVGGKFGYLDNPKRYKSMFNDSRFYYRPTSKDADGKVPSKNLRPHGATGDGDDLYDVSTNSIISYTQKAGHEAMFLRASDFAYLRDLGVYPNNRLIIARRFSTPVPNDLTSTSHRPISTIIGWVKEEDKEFGLEGMEFNEVWTEGDASLTKILNDMLGKEEVGAGVSGGIGSMVKVAKSAVPLPGLTRGFQYDILKRLGIKDVSDNIPDGNPNFIQQSMRRKTIAYDDNDSGLASAWSVTLNTTYEQKFINGADPTIVFLDLIGNLLRFGTSKSEFFINGKGGDLFNKFFDNFKKGNWVAAIKIIVGVVSDAIREIANKIGDFFSDLADPDEDEDRGDILSNAFQKIAESIGDSLISKYKVRIASVIAAWTGQASTPWHVTIGNPKKPFFSSGDMLCERVQLKFGTVLAFNDLPSTIEVTVKLKPARNLGLQELFERFNNGAGRSYVALSDTYESDNPNRYWDKWWDDSPKDPNHTANDGLSTDANEEQQIKAAQEKSKKDYETQKVKDAWFGETTENGSNNTTS
jgi:hypothetical protein